ncbi:fimbrial protein [Erwinia sp. ACCC 02193]|jgi:type 1 fimbria pilin|uniref:Fimbrial protein n=1 Tax=Erwinia aeris TaxID=3239803 RepID=A0ABV4E5D4_9GAMM|nr:fimbrial protein [Erwinia sp. BC051422]MDN8542235.1 fimbrial protein [Erwinia sp. BC051422]
MDRTTTFAKAVLCTLTGLTLFSGRVTAAPEVFTFTMTANVVQSASCQLNEGKNVEVSFGDQVDIAKINGTNYQSEIAYNFSCKQQGKNAVTLQIDGTGADFGQGMLYVQPGLAIKIMNDGKLQPVNTSFAIDGTDPPVLMAVLVKNTAASLTPGYFEATATIKAVYE